MAWHWEIDGHITSYRPVKDGETEEELRDQLAQELYDIGFDVTGWSISQVGHNFEPIEEMDPVNLKEELDQERKKTACLQEQVFLMGDEIDRLKELLGVRE